MENAFNYLLQTRKNIIKVLKSFEDKLHILPEGFANNLYWNGAHCLVTQQLLCYGLSSLPLAYESDFIGAFRKGSKANSEEISTEQFSWLIEELEQSAHKMKADYESGLFKEYREYTTSYGLTLKSSEDAIEFNTVHEGLHLGYMMALRKML